MNFLIDETTREERIEIINKALAISQSGAERPSDMAMQLAEEYVEGRMELEEIQKIIVEKYKKNQEEGIV